jgi:hypothetical protein
MVTGRDARRMLKKIAMGFVQEEECNVQMDYCGGGFDVGVVGSGRAASTSSNAGGRDHQSQRGVWSGHAPSEWRVHQNGRPPWRKQVCQGSDLLS